MTTNRCPFCDHENPVDAKFCGGCGVLNLLPCPNCGAVNENSATTCYRCHTKLEPAVADAPRTARDKAAAPVLAGGEPSLVESAPSRGQPLAVLVGVVLIAVATAAYFFYRSRAETPSSVTAGSAAPSIAAPVNAPVAKAGVGGGSTKPEASPVSPTPAPAKEHGDTPQAKPVVAVKAEPVAAAPAAAPAPVQATPEPVQAAPAPAVAAAMTKQSEPAEPGSRASRFSAPGGMGAGRSKPPAQCTAAIAALGLCTLQSN